MLRWLKDVVGGLGNTFGRRNALAALLGALWLLAALVRALVLWVIGLFG